MRKMEFLSYFLIALGIIGIFVMVWCFCYDLQVYIWFIGLFMIHFGFLGSTLVWDCSEHDYTTGCLNCDGTGEIIKTSHGVVNNKYSEIEKHVVCKYCNGKGSIPLIIQEDEQK